MIYGVGVGQSGTRSLVKLMQNGLWEGLPHICAESIDYYLTKEKTPILMDKLKERAKIDVLFIGNNKHSLVIDLLHEIDPLATFVWEIREPIGNIKSLYKRFPYITEGKNRVMRIYPQGGFPKDWGDFKKSCWLWTEKNLYIEKILKKLDLEHRVVFADDIPIRTGGDIPDTKASSYNFSDEELVYIEKNVMPLWNRYKKEYGEKSKKFVEEQYKRRR